MTELHSETLSGMLLQHSVVITQNQMWQTKTLLLALWWQSEGFTAPLGALSSFIIYAHWEISDVELLMERSSSFPAIFPESFHIVLRSSNIFLLKSQQVVSKRTDFFVFVHKTNLL